MAKSTGNKVYAVAAGRVPGIYFSWGDCQAQVSGYKGAVFKSFHQRHEAESFFHLHASTADLRSSSATVISSKIVPRTSCIASDGNSRSPLGCGESEGVSHEKKIFRGPGVSYVSKKVYAVASGRKPGVYASWPECQAQTKGFSRPIFKSFKTIDEAEDFIKQNSPEGHYSDLNENGKRPLEKIANQNPLESKKQMKQNVKMQITIHFDGGSRGNPGIAGAGAEVVVISKPPATSSSATIKSNDDDHSGIMKTTYLVRQFCGNRATNNFAEYTGLISGLQKAKMCAEEYLSKLPVETTPHSSKTLRHHEDFLHVQIYGDSNLIIQQLKGIYQCKNGNIRPLFQQCKALIEELKGIGGGKNSVLCEHVYRERNKVADALANEAMDQCKSWTTSSSVEIESKIKVAVKNGDDGEVIDVDADDDDDVILC
mmetsp:Transcript_27079/g.54721  ORF Transcript_27079/g.54721 Transcript_27079/m.54721 type:complete len:427 (-) Transcript_27079:50-1330(-)